MEEGLCQLAWERRGIPVEELDKVAEGREVWTSLLMLLPPNQTPHQGLNKHG